jgi:predicted RNA-binding Zn-ribbon protein involved in translation (DUF1610 family)
MLSGILQSGILWKFLEWVLFAVLAVLALGLIVGSFTYGRPPRKRRKNQEDGFMDAILGIGEGLSHLLIDKLLGNKRVETGEWLDDQQLLAMLRGMSPSEFEEFVAKVFAALGYETELNGGSGDGGIDIIMKKNGRNFVVQCKKFITRKVNPHDVRDFYGAMGDRHIDGKGFFVTTNIFTLEAEQFAEGKPMELIDGTRLVELVRDSKVMAVKPAESKAVEAKPVEPASEPKCPNCGGVLVVRTNKREGNHFWGCSNFPKCRYTRPKD